MEKFYINLVLAISALALNESSQAQSAFAYLEANNFRCSINSAGGLFWIPGSGMNTCEVPQGLGIHPIFSSRLWFGGISPDQQLKLAGETYNASGHDWWPGPLTTDGSASTTFENSALYDRLWLANSADVAIHIAYFEALANGNVEVEFPEGYTIPEWMFEWPAHGDFTQSYSYYLAPFFDFDQDGMFMPENGDYPLFCGDRCVYFIMNDKVDVHSESNGLPIGLEIHGMFYAFEATENPDLDNTVFLSYRIINRGTQTLNDTYVGMFSDFELPQEYIGTNVKQSAVFAYHSDGFDESGYGDNPGIIAMSVLGGPWKDADEVDNPLVNEDFSSEINAYGNYSWGFNDGIIDNERLGLSGSMYLTNDASITGEPNTALDYYNFMRTVWKNGQNMTYGGTGVNSSGSTSSNYVFPGDSDPLHTGTNGMPMSAWTETEAGNIPGDRRALASSGPFTLEPQAVHYLDLAFVFARQNEGEGNLEETLDERLMQTKIFFNENLVNCHLGPSSGTGVAEEAVSSREINLYPNPASGQVNVRWTANFEQLVLLDLTGKQLQVLNITGISSRVLDLRSVPSGVYFVRLSGPSGTQVKKLLVD